MSILNPMSLPTGGAGEVYSAEETRIGTWIDGKPLYRRVYQITTPAEDTGESAYYICKNIPIPDTWENMRCYGFMVDKYNFSMPIPSYWQSGMYIIAAPQPGQYLMLKSRGPNNLNRPATIILEYTKTTD